MFTNLILISCQAFSANQHQSQDDTAAAQSRCVAKIGLPSQHATTAPNSTKRDVPVMKILNSILESSIRRLRRDKLERQANPLLLPLRLILALLRILLLPLRILLAPLIILLRALAQLLRLILRLLIEALFQGFLFIANIGRILLLIVAEILRLILRIRLFEEKDEHTEENVITLVDDYVTTTTTTHRPKFHHHKQGDRKKRRPMENRRTMSTKLDRTMEIEQLNEELYRKRIFIEKILKLIMLVESYRDFDFRQDYWIDTSKTLKLVRQPVCLRHHELDCHFRIFRTKAELNIM